MKKYLIILLILLVILSIFGVIFLRNNTSFLNFDISEEEISQNNLNPTSLEVAEIDLVNLVSKELVVNEIFQSGAFSEPRTLNLPEDYEISVYAGGMRAPRFFDFDEEGNIYVADKSSGEVLLLKDEDGDKVAETKITVLSDLRSVHSVDFYNGDLYVAEEHQISILKGVKSDGTFDEFVILIANLPSDGGHTTRTVVIGPDEKIYVSIGSSCNLCEEEDERRAAVVRYNLDGSGEELYAEGLRNSVGLEFYNFELWSVDNGRDRIGDDLPPEEVNIIEKGKHYGWPFCYGMGVTNPEYPDRSDYCENETAYPVYEMQAHSAPLGLTFAPISGDLEGNLFTAFHGSWNRSVPTGYKVVRIDTTNDNAETVNFITGWLDENGDIWGRPVGVKFNEQGEFFVSDDEAGALYIMKKLRN
jgi:glucose/arabinose dehydrogenase